jgi:DmpG-like communication domain
MLPTDKLVGGQEDLLIDLAIDLTAHTAPPSSQGITWR